MSTISGLYSDYYQMYECGCQMSTFREKRPYIYIYMIGASCNIAISCILTVEQIVRILGVNRITSTKVYIYIYMYKFKGWATPCKWQGLGDSLHIFI